MANKSPNEQGGAMVPSSGMKLAKTDPSMSFQEVSNADFVIPQTFESLVAEGFETQRHVKLGEGKFIRGLYAGMEDGELAARTAQDGTIQVPKVKWVFVKTDETVTVRMLGAYNMITQLERVPIGSELVIGRGSDYQLPNGFRCTDYFVLHKPPNTKGAAAAVIETQKV